MRYPRLPAEDIERFGLRWGQLDVVRIASDYRGRTLDITTGHKRLTVWVSAGGRSVRVYDADGVELKRGCK